MLSIASDDLNTMRSIFCKSFIFLLFLSGSSHARNYVVDLIVFERLDQQRVGEEVWNVDSNQVARHRQALTEIGTKSSGIRINAGTSRLKRVEGNLSASGYRILQSARWVQPGRVFNEAPIINVTSANGRLRGYIRIYKTSLIFADIKLGITDPSVASSEFSSLSNPVSANLPVFFIEDKRRLKFKEVHYFDHPKFGAILTVWPAN